MTIWARLAIYLAGLIGAGLGLLLILPLGLVVVEWVVFPLALAVGALLAALAAGWVGTWLAGNGTRTRLAPVVAITEAVGLGLALIVLGSAALWTVLFGPVIGIAGVASLVLAIAAGTATGVWRRPATAPHGDRAATLILILLAIVGAPIVVFLASLAGLTGA